MSNIVPYNDIERMGAVIAKSNLFGIKTPDQAIALMLVAQAENMHPAIAARDYHIIQGRPALKADAMLARFQQAGGSVKWSAMADDRVAAVFSHPQGGSIEIDWDMARAKRADLGGKDMWKKYPRQMLRARVISEGIRTVFPGCVAGFYTPEEVQDFDSKPEASPRDVSPKNVTPAAPAATQEAIEGEVLPPSDGPTLDDVRSACTNAAKRVGSNAPVVAMIQIVTGNAQAKSVKDIPSDKWGSVIDSANAMEKAEA